jgi:hypothetical protein
MSRLLTPLRRGWRIGFEMSSLIPATPDLVWGLITDWERQGDWMLEARDFEVIGRRRTGVGVEARATVSIAGITTTDTVVVTAWEPEKRLALRHEGWVSGSGEMRLIPTGLSGTTLVWTEQLEPPLGVLGAAGITAFKPIMQRVFDRDLRVLGELGRRAMLERGF